MKILQSLLLVVIGSVLGGGSVYYLFPEFLNMSSSLSMEQMDKKEPLYWVAPMNPDFKRDKPGKSPMGMDLLPIYADSPLGIDEESGTVRISPDVVNNLGVRITQVIRQSLKSEIKTVGYVQYDEDKLIHVHPRVEGWVEKLYVKATGDPVKKGQALYTLYSPNLVNAQEELLIALQRKNERLIRAAQTRLKALNVSAWFIASLKKTRKVKQSVTFYAPQSGVVTMLNIREGFFVKPETSMMTIGQIDEVWVQAEIFERQAEQVKVGLPVTMTLSYLPGREWQGKVDYIYPTLDQTTRTLRVRLRFDNKDKLLMPNMFTQVIIHMGVEEPILMLPREAVIRTGDMDRVVLALGEGSFKSIMVKIGRSDNDYIEILEGINDGDNIVVSAQFLIDSESSKTSDFKRMNHEMNGMRADMKAAVEVENPSAEVEGMINLIMPTHRMINITRGSIPKWNRDEATLDFIADDDIDLSQLAKGQKVDFRFEIDNDSFVIKEIKPHTNKEVE
ncbi:MAG: efflux transporter periplasmic adaptor subunit [Methylophaga sp.]|nr:MAG: efflux transporter periplasmic adaptor subunit [Methylophaga sp.]